MLPLGILPGAGLTAWPTTIRYPDLQLTVDLGFNRIAELPPSVGSPHYSRLVILRLHHNAFTAWPTDFAAFPVLAELNLSSNPLPDPPPNLPSPGELEALNLCGIGLSRLPENWLGPHLAELGLNRNRLAELPDSFFTRCHGLVKLDLAHNHLRTLPPDLGRCTELRELDLSYNQIETLPDSLGELADLEILNLQGNHLRALPESLGRLRRLRRLIVHENQLTALPTSLGKLAALEYLDASANHLCALPPEIVRCHSLAWLVLSQNQLDHLPPDLTNLTELQRAFFTQNQLTALPPDTPSNGRPLLPPLTILELSRNPIPKPLLSAYQSRPPESRRWSLLWDN